MIRRIFSRAAVAAIGLLLVTLTGLVVTRAVRQHEISGATRIAVPPGVDSLERIELGGVAQWIQIRGHNRVLPVLLMLHGGPGLPDMPYEYVNAALEKNFLVVEWDQRGAGKSFDAKAPTSSMRLEQFVSDARELIALLCQRFEQKQIFLAAHSSGTVIGLVLVSREPQLFRAYIGISQVANLQQSESFLYDLSVRVAGVRGNKAAGMQLAQIGPPPFANAKELQISQKWANEFAPDRFGALSYERLRLAFFSPAYSFADLFRFVRGAKFSFDNLWRELFAVDLFRQVPQVDVPVYFLGGRHDRVVTSEVAEKYFNALRAPRGKQLIWFERSGHWPQLEEPEKFRSEMVDRILAENPPAPAKLSLSKSRNNEVATNSQER